MNLVSADDLRIDRCPSCRGIWLDCGELRKVEKVAATLEKPASRLLRVARSLESQGYQILDR